MLDPDRIYRQLEEAGNDWADKKSAYDALDRCSKSVLARITHTFMADGTTRVLAETEALCSKEYEEHLSSVARAHKAFLQAQVLWDNLQTLAELRRSEESTRRAEMKL